VKKIRDICGPTNPHVAREKRPGCIRALGTVVLLKDAAGNDVGERMDNLIHASASEGEAEREVKLWFSPSDFPPFMRSFPTEINENEHYYFKDGRLFKTHEPGSVCLIAPGEVVWKSDFDALRTLQQGLPALYSVGAVAAKYLINYAVET
jgi:nucleoside-diphosphate kinase